MLLRGKMKRAFFCCLRGGNFTVDVTSRKKCNYCRFDKLKECSSFADFFYRFEKCKIKGMVPDSKEKRHIKVLCNRVFH